MALVWLCWVVILSVTNKPFMLSVVMLNVVAPFLYIHFFSLRVFSIRILLFGQMVDLKKSNYEFEDFKGLLAEWMLIGAKVVAPSDLQTSCWWRFASRWASRRSKSRVLPSSPGTPAADVIKLFCFVTQFPDKYKLECLYTIRLFSLALQLWAWTGAGHWGTVGAPL